MKMLPLIPILIVKCSGTGPLGGLEASAGGEEAHGVPAKGPATPGAGTEDEVR